MATPILGKACLTSLAVVLLFLSSSRPLAAAADSRPTRPNFVFIDPGNASETVPFGNQRKVGKGGPGAKRRAP